MIKQLLIKILSLNIFLPFKKGKRFIFIYHDVSTVDAPQHSVHYSTTPERFEQHLEFFRKHFDIVSLDQIVAHRLDKKRNYAAIVFDDGFKSVKTIAAPLLKARKMPFAIFANKGAVLQNRLWLSDLELGNTILNKKLQDQFGLAGNKDLIESLKSNVLFNNTIASYMDGSMFENADIYLNASEIKQLRDDGVIIGSHTVNHPVLSCCDEVIQKQEIEENKYYLDQILDQHTTHFAFPFGKKEHFSPATIELLKKAGHQYFYTSNPNGFSHNEISSGLIPRIGLLNDDEAQIMFYINRQFLRKIDL